MKLKIESFHFKINGNTLEIEDNHKKIFSVGFDEVECVRSIDIKKEKVLVSFNLNEKIIIE